MSTWCCICDEPEKDCYCEDHKPKPKCDKCSHYREDFELLASNDATDLDKWPDRVERIAMILANISKELGVTKIYFVGWHENWRLIKECFAISGIKSKLIGEHDSDSD